MPRGSNTGYIILGLLSEMPLSGYDIKKYIDFRFRNFWSESYGQIYPHLASLEKRGDIRKSDISDSNAQSGKRERIVYEITEQGRKSLTTWLETPCAREQNRYEMLVRLYFGNMIPPEKIQQMITEFGERYEREAGILEEVMKELGSIPDPTGHHSYVKGVVRFGQKVYAAYLDWVEEMKGGSQ